jgi:YbbR domain-containing protein
MMEHLLKNKNVAKILAFFLALTLWFYVAGGTLRTEVQDVTRTFTNVPLAWHNLNDQLILTEVPSEIDVLLRGRADIIDEMSPQDLEIFVDLKGLDEGQHRLVPNGLVPRGTRIISYRPQQVVATLEEVLLQQKTVTLEIKGSPVEGLVMGTPRILPDSVFIRGAKSVVAEVDRVSAELNMDGAADNKIQMVPVKAINKAGQEVAGVVVNPNLVEVMVPLSQPQKEVPIRVPLIGEPAAGHQVRLVSAEPMTVIIMGKEELLQSVTEVLTSPVTVSEATESIQAEVNLILPQGLELATPGKVMVEIIIGPL